MPHYQMLETEKYYVEANKHAVKQIQNRRVVSNLLSLAFGLAIIMVTIYAIREMPNWLPAMVDYIELKTYRWI